MYCVPDEDRRQHENSSYDVTKQTLQLIQPATVTHKFKAKFYFKSSVSAKWAKNETVTQPAKWAESEVLPE